MKSALGFISSPTNGWEFVNLHTHYVLRRNLYLLTIVTIILMLAIKRIPVTETVWAELSDLKSAGQTYSQLLEEMIEDRKKARFFRDMERIEERGEFVEFPW
jgi:predicted CopG family antitoxin